MTDCIQLQAEIEACEQAASELEQEYWNQEAECMTLWTIYWTDCDPGMAAAVGASDFDRLKRGRHSQMARRIVEGLRESTK